MATGIASVLPTNRDQTLLRPVLQGMHDASSTICIVGAKRIEVIEESQSLSIWIHMINNFPKLRVRIEPAGEGDIP